MIFRLIDIRHMGRPWRFTACLFLTLSVWVGGHAQQSGQWEPVGLTFHPQAIVEDVFSDPSGNSLVLAGLFSDVNDTSQYYNALRWYGQSPSSISGTVASDWLPNVGGKVYDGDYFMGDVFLIGAFSQFETSPHGAIAVWDSVGQWAEPINASVSLRSISVTDTMLFIGCISPDGNIGGISPLLYTYNGTLWDTASVWLDGDSWYSVESVAHYDNRYFVAGNMYGFGGRDMYEWLPSEDTLVAV